MVRGSTTGWRGTLAVIVLGLSLALAGADSALAQSRGQSFTVQGGSSATLPPSGGGANLLPPSGGVNSPTLQSPGFGNPGSTLAPGPGTSTFSTQGQLALAARFGRDLGAVTGGLHWRVYSGRPDPNGAMRLVKEERVAGPVIALPPGSYIVHVSLGLASAVRPVQLRAGEPVREIFDLPAGGLMIKGQVGDVRIPVGQITFDIFKGSQFEVGDRRPLAQSVASGDVVLLPEGTYYIVSNYGEGNSVVRSDIRVQAARLTDVTVTHRAAVITLKLVNERGGEAVANTAWSVLTPGGDVIKEAIGAFPRVVLAEGEYRALARNEGRMFQRDFRVITGVDGEIEVLAR